MQAMIEGTRKHNPREFLNDLKRVRDVLVYSSTSNIFLKVRKKEVISESKKGTIHYYLSDKVFYNRRLSMIII